MIHRAAFLVPPAIPRLVAGTARTEHRWRPRTRLLQPATVACIQRSPDDEKPSSNSQPLQTKHEAEPTNAMRTPTDHLKAFEDETFNEMDQIAEEWIGADLCRWEWYERMKSRRNKLRVAIDKREKDIDKDLEELRRTFMEVDAVFGTKMLDDNSEVTFAGWSVIAFSMALYIVVGYSLFEFFVTMLTSAAPPSFP